VTYGKNSPERGYVIGRLESTGDRFVAMAPDEPALLADMLTREQLGRKVALSEEGGHNVFRSI
jgi:acetyl-CoA C-acetyltransferase